MAKAKAASRKSSDETPARASAKSARSGSAEPAGAAGRGSRRDSRLPGPADSALGVAVGSEGITEVAEKRARLKAYLEAHRLDCLLLSSQALFSWYTGGYENRVVLADTGGAAVIVADAQRDVIVTTNIEATRLRHETDLEARGFTIREVPWFNEDDYPAEIRAAIGDRRCRSEMNHPKLATVDEDFFELTYALSDPEVARYRQLGRDCSEAMEEALETIQPGMREFEVSAAMAKSLLSRGVLPNLVLVASDERLKLYRHPLCTPKRIKKAVMAVLCGKRNGLIVNMTRLLHFGPVPADLRRRTDAVLRVDVAVNHDTRVGTPVSDIFRRLVNTYREVGYPDEWRLHHQGGPTGYQGRSYKANFEEHRRVLRQQAFAWNPSIAGTKSEDTILVHQNGIEFLSQPVRGPSVKVATPDGSAQYARADIICR
ncbi:MAG: M24 family metallopeptidase [Planctomycetota bacterium]